MFPNPQDALPLPQRPKLEQYRKLAKELVRAARVSEDAIRDWASHWNQRAGTPLRNRDHAGYAGSHRALE